MIIKVPEYTVGSYNLLVSIDDRLASAGHDYIEVDKHHIDVKVDFTKLSFCSTKCEKDGFLKRTFAEHFKETV